MKNRTGEEGGQNRKQGNLLCTVICIAEIVQKVTVYKLETENRDRIGEKTGFVARSTSVKPCGTCRVGHAVLWPRLNACENM